MSSSPTNNRDQQFCLRWNNYQSNLTQVFHQLFQSETFVDVTLACEGKSVKAHRLVLSACSPYFLTVLTETPCSHPVIILQGVKWAELKAVVEFMYKGEINICQEQLASLLRVAENLKIRGLADVGGEEAEAVLTSPSESPRASQFWAEDTPRKRRRLSDEPRSRSRSRSPTPGPHTPAPHTPASVSEPLDPIIDLPGGNISRGSSSASNPPPSLPSPSPVASLASSLSSLAHLHAPMGPPPGPPLPPHLAHLPPLSPLSPLLNMHPMSRHHSPEDFEIRPGIAEMIREEERRIREFPAKLLESTHHWIGNPMADKESSFSSQPQEEDLRKSSSLKEALRKICKANGRFRSSKNKDESEEKNNDTSHHKPFPINNNNTKSKNSSYRSKYSSKWSQEDLTAALMMVRNGTPIKPAAEKFNIPVMTLWRRTRALGLVSSKVQCGFRYSSSKGNAINTFSTLSFHNKTLQNYQTSSTPTTSQYRERSPLTESNFKISQSENSFLKSKLLYHKENSPEDSFSTCEPPDSQEDTAEMSNEDSVMLSDPNVKVPTKEFLVWLNCLGPQQNDSKLANKKVERDA